MKCLSRRKLTRTTSRIFGDVVGTSLWVLQYECLLILLCRRKKRGMRRNILSHPTLNSNSLYCGWWIKISSVISRARNETILRLNSMYRQTGRHFRGLETSTWVATSVAHEVAFTKYVIVVLPFFSEVFFSDHAFPCGYMHISIRNHRLFKVPYFFVSWDRRCRSLSSRTAMNFVSWCERNWREYKMPVRIPPASAVLQRMKVKSM